MSREHWEYTGIIQIIWTIDCIEKLFGCKINKKVVLYLGEDTMKMVGGEKVLYKNINNFLKRF